MKTRMLRAPLFLFAFLLTAATRAEIEFILDNNFIATFKDRVTIDAHYTVVKAHPKPNPGAKDGDLHIAGTAPEIGLATVAEIMNAKDDKKALQAIHDAESSGQPIPITGAWRIWCEHGGGDKQEQFGNIEPITTTNPDHVFEIHPISKVDTRSVLKTFKPIPGFTPKDAHDAFVKYEGISCRITPAGNQTRILTTMAGYNYVKFTMELLEDPMTTPTGDGSRLFANVRDLEGELLVRKRRMLFVKDSPPEKTILTKLKGDRVKVLGVPRIDLALIEWRRNHADDPREPLKWHLPYEIIVVATYKGSADEDEP